MNADRILVQDFLRIQRVALCVPAIIFRRRVLFFIRGRVTFNNNSG